MAELHCPDTKQLQQLLKEMLDAATGSELSAHVEGCSACQKTLESLSPMSQSWTDVLAGIACEEPAPEPGLERVLKNAAPADASETQDEPAAGEHAESLAFLAPPAKPGHLGRLGHYEIHEVIGRGGFGIVLKAFDEKLHRVVAVKVLSPQLAASATARNRFSREARAAAAVTHDHVVTIHVVDEDHRPPFLVMQMIDGQTLQQKLNKVGALTLTEILRIGMQTAAGLAAAHKQGLVHRDIKPANILLENGVERVKITDFGLARLADDASITQSGVVAGTPMYMSPEQANGEAIDYRSDLFSLGTVLYVMCTGRPPFRASGTMAVLKRVIDDTPRPIREINPEIPEWLCDIIARLHAKDRKDRYQSAREVAELLSQHLAILQQAVSASGPHQFGRAEPRKGPGEAPALASSTRSLTRLGSPKHWLLSASLLGVLAVVLAFIYWPRDGAVVPPEQKEHVEQKKPPVVLSADTQPFVILAKDTRTETHHSTLAAAVAWAQSGDTIEIRGDGPFVTGPIKLQKKALAIRAGGGFRPHLKYQSTEPTAKEALLHTEAPLVLEGLTLERAGPPNIEDYLPAHVLHAVGAPLHVIHCRLIGTKIICAAGFAETPAGTLSNSEILGDTYTGISLHTASSSLLSLENNVIAVRFHGLRFGQRSAVAKADMTFRHNTVRAGLPLNFDVVPALDFVEGGDAKSPEFRLDAVGNVLDNAATAQFFFSPVHKSLPLEKAAPLLPKLLSFQDQHNLYAMRDKYFLVINREGAANGVRSFEALAEWHQFWGIAKSTSQVGRPVYQGDDVRAKALSAPTKLTPADFRLAKGSPGKGAGPGGKDLGADVNLVGPGAAYEKWQKTPAYQEWRKQTDDLMAKAAATAPPFVILAKDTRAEQRHRTLAAAVDAAQSGDTIEIHGNGPFETLPIDIQKRVLTIRAGQGWRPVVSLHQEMLANAKVEKLPAEALSLLRTEAALLLEGLQFQVLDPKLVKTGQQRPPVVCIHSFGGSLHLANCSIVMSRKGLNLRNMAAIRAYDPAHVSVKNCTLQSEMGQMIGMDLFAPWGGRFEALLDNCTLAGHDGVSFHPGRPGRMGSLDLVIRQSTVWGGGFMSVGSVPWDPDAENLIRVTTRQNVVAGHLWYTQRTPARPVSEALPYLKRLVKWQEEKTLWLNRPEQGRLQISDQSKLLPDQPKSSSLEDWNRIWGLADTGSILGTPRFVNEDLLSKAYDSASLTPADFRLAKGSPGQGVLPGGKDLGADVDLVGPGAAYEKWQKTPEYLVWRKQTDDLMAKAATTQAAETQPFVVLAKDKRVQTRYATLAAAVAWAQSGDTIEIQGNGPFVIDKTISTESRALTIRAGVGFTPVLQRSVLEDDHSDHEYVLYAQGPLVLEGLNFRLANQAKRKVLSVVLAEKSTLRMANCQASGTGVCVLTNAIQGAEFRNCRTHFPRADYFAIGWRPAPHAKPLVIDNCVLHGSGWPLTVHFGQRYGLPQGDQRVEITRCTMLPRNIGVEFRYYDLPKTQLEKPVCADLVLQDSIFQLNHGIVFIESRDPARPFDAKESERIRREHIRLKDQRNLFKTKGMLFGSHFFDEKTNGPAVQDANEPTATTLAEWNALWNLKDTGSEIGEPRFVGGELSAKLQADPHRLEAADFRLAKGSPGQGVLPGGKDLGADVDLVGPGAAYDRWKQTPAYQEWLEKTRKLMEGN